MNKKELKQLEQESKVHEVDLAGEPLKPGQEAATQSLPPAPTGDQDLEFNLKDFTMILSALRQIRRHLDAAPDFVPQNFLEQIQFVDDGAGNQSVYFFINNTWRGVDLPLT